ncbi:MAG: DUF5107 domain-containing protein [Flavitalea sp.]
MKSFLFLIGLLFGRVVSFTQQPSTVREYAKAFTTYPFSDPDPVPEFGKIYPYYRFDGYTNQPIKKEWKVVELENDYLKVMILPEIGGKIWSAIEKKTGKSFIYFNHVVKFRDVAMRGPWTSGGIEANYGIVGHTPNCATPVDYTILKKADGSVSCVIGVLDLLTRTSWRIDINLGKDKAYFTTSSFWYNSSSLEQPYYTWMNAALQAKGNLQFVYPGTKYIGHEGEYADWPMDKNGRDLSYYNNNNFGEYKSYHVFGKRTDFFGGYYHDEDFGMARYSNYDDKPGKKIWIWGLSPQGMIWEKLLSDTDGQYVEIQSGRLFNQPAENSTFSPFKNRGFLPNAADTWKEFWFPVVKTKGFVSATNYGALNIKRDKERIKIYFSAIQDIHDNLIITSGDKLIYSKIVVLKPMQLFADSINIASDTENIVVRLGKDKLVYESSPSANVISRPVATPENFDWNSVQGLYVQGKELIKQRMYVPAEEKLRAALKSDPNYLPALSDLSMVLFRHMQYIEALEYAKKALSVDTYDPEANYYYGLINERAGNIADAKDGYSIASEGLEYRSASFAKLASISLNENDMDRAIHYAFKSLDYNKYAIDAYQLLAVIYRLQNNKTAAAAILDTLSSIDPLNHFSHFEKYLWDSSEVNKKQFTDNIRNEMPAQTYLELAIWYYNSGQKATAAKVLDLSAPDIEVMYWQSFLTGKMLDIKSVDPNLIFPFRPETADVLQQLILKNDNWLLKYHLALIQWGANNKTAARKLFDQCGEQPVFAPFYAARAKLYDVGDSGKVLKDIQKAHTIDGKQWRYGRSLINYYTALNQNEKALTIAAQEYKKYPDNYILGMSYINVLVLNRQYATAEKLLNTISILPNEGSTAGRQLYHEVKLMMAIADMKKNHLKKGLQHIDEARKWPERLGSGKPYEEDIDERLENWMAYKFLGKMNDKTGEQQMLDKIIAYTPKIKVVGRPTVNHMVTALALKITGKDEVAKELLNDVLAKHPNSAVAKWMVSAYNSKHESVPDELKTNEGYVVLEQLNSFK